MKKKGLVTTVVAFALSLAASMTAFAGQWQQNENGWWYQNDDGSYPTNQWQWIDSNGDGIAERYYFDSNGYMLTNTTTPDGGTVNSDGIWTQYDVVRTKNLSAISTTDKFGYMKQEYFDVMGKDPDYVFSVLGTPNDSYETLHTYYLDNGDTLDISFYDNQLGSLTCYLYGGEQATEQETVAEIERRLNAPLERNNGYDNKIYYTWDNGLEPRLDLMYIPGNSYSLYWVPMDM